MMSRVLDACRNLGGTRSVAALGASLLLLPLTAVAVRAQPPAGRDSQTVRGTVRSFTTAPKGETDGAKLDDGTWLHWPPHMQDRFTDVIKKGDRVRATGRTETGPAGDTHFEVQSVTNLRTKDTARNPDFAAAPPPPPGGPRRLARGRAGDVEQRLQALEDKIDQLQKEIDRLRRKK